MHILDKYMEGNRDLTNHKILRFCRQLKRNPVAIFILQILCVSQSQRSKMCELTDATYRYMSAVQMSAGTVVPFIGKGTHLMGK